MKPDKLNLSCVYHYISPVIVLLLIREQSQEHIRAFHGASTYLGEIAERSDTLRVAPSKKWQREIWDT